MSRAAQAGFTLVELVIVIVITAVLAVAASLYMRPAFEAYADTRSRSEIASVAAVSLQRIARDVAMAVPNSIRTPDAACFDLVPSSASGRVRLGTDIVNSGSVPLDLSQPTAQLDVLTPLDSLPAAGTWLVMGNQTAADLYAGLTRTAIAGSAGEPGALGTARLTLASAFQFPQGLAGGRFQLVSAAQGVVSYVCSGAGVAQGRGTGTLWRISGQAFSAVAPGSCPDVAPGMAGAQRIATGLSSCSFSYDPGATSSQQYGLLALQFGFTRGGETATLVNTLQVLNKP